MLPDVLLTIEANRIFQFAKKFRLSTDSNESKTTLLLIAYSLDSDTEINAIEMLLHIDRTNICIKTLKNYCRNTSFKELTNSFLVVFSSLLRFCEVNESNELIDAILAKAEKNFSLSSLRRAISALKLINERPQFLSFNSKIWFPKQCAQLEYELRKIFKKKLLSKVAVEPIEDRRRILILFGHAQPLANVGSHWRQLATYAQGFASLGYEVEIVITNEDTTNFSFSRQNLHALPRNWRAILEKQLYEIADGEFKDKIALRLFNPYEDMDYFNQVSEQILRSGAFVTFAWQGFFTSDLFIEIAKQVSTVVAIEFQAGNPKIPCADYCFIQGKLANRRVEESNVFEAPIPLVPEPNNGTWNGKAISDNGRKVIVTVLGNGRIERAFNEIYSDQFLEKLASSVAKHSDIEWHLIGVDENALSERASKFFKLCNKFKLIDYVNDLRSYYNQCSYYIHLPALGGGGWGVALAAFEKLPILYQKGGDSDNFLIEEATYAHDSFIESFEKIISSEIEQLTFQSDKQFAQLTLHTPENAASALIAPVLRDKNIE
tara:strand:+ start:1773 stop:3413 length:1641 start_codon:yes stop_codon:yes gene_type:complete